MGDLTSGEKSVIRSIVRSFNGDIRKPNGHERLQKLLGDHGFRSVGVRLAVRLSRTRKKRRKSIHRKVKTKTRKDLSLLFH